jgi:hypothetical protein
LCQTLIVTPRPVILVDWTVVTHTHWALVASIPCKGRAQIIYQQVYLKKHVASPNAQKRFLVALSKVIPPGCTPIVIADAGFMGPWFAKLRPAQVRFEPKRWKNDQPHGLIDFDTASSG